MRAEEVTYRSLRSGAPFFGWEEEIVEALRYLVKEVDNGLVLFISALGLFPAILPVWLIDELTRLVVRLLGLPLPERAE